MVNSFRRKLGTIFLSKFEYKDVQVVSKFCRDNYPTCMRKG